MPYSTLSRCDTVVGAPHLIGATLGSGLAVLLRATIDSRQALALSAIVLYAIALSVRMVNDAIYVIFTASAALVRPG